LLQAFADANIPLCKLENTRLKNFLQKYTGEKIMDESHYRKNLISVLYDEKINEVKNNYNNCPIYIIFDETTDFMKRYILNILIGKCDPIKYSKPILIKTIELTKTNSININSEIIFLLFFFILPIKQNFIM
jgi:hypothetical protein